MISVCILLVMVFNILICENSDIVDIYWLYFGKYFGGVLIFVVLVYYFIFVLIIYWMYVEIL